MVKRIKSLKEVVGHSDIVKWFQGCIQRDRLPQVIMLSGPTGLGKTSIAQIVACEIAYMNNPEQLETAKKAVIEEGKSTDAVRLYNMSNLKSQEAVHEVKSDLSIGFSSTGRKVIIMDEAHGMSEEAQDSLLTAFEALQSQVYIIVCTTELSSFREAFVGRCLLRRLTNLSQAEIRVLLKRWIEDNRLKFDIPLTTVYGLISLYTGREPRRALNLLDSFEPGSLITSEELNTFVNIYEGKQLISLIDYLYSGSILAGLDFIADVEIGSTFVATLLEVLRVAQGGQSAVLDRDATLHIRDLISKNDDTKLLGFCIDVSTTARLNRNKLSGFFIKWCAKSDAIFKGTPVPVSIESVRNQDMTLMRPMLEQKEMHATIEQDAERLLSLEELLAESETIE